MSFSQATITSVAPPVFQNGFATFTWQTTSPPGTWFQVYVDLELAWYGQTTTTTVPIPTGPVSIDIGTVAAGEQTTSFASSLPSVNRCALLSWLGGTFESAELAGFYIYAAPAAGAAVNYSTSVGSVTAYPAGVYTDGFGFGGFGDGGFGESASSYSWQSGPLGGGTWAFAVRPYDFAGNLGTATTSEVSIQAPPLEPAWNYVTQSRLNYTFNHVSEEVTLTWLASPSA